MGRSLDLRSTILEKGSSDPDRSNSQIGRAPIEYGSRLVAPACSWLQLASSSCNGGAVLRVSWGIPGRVLSTQKDHGVHVATAQILGTDTESNI